MSEGNGTFDYQGAIKALLDHARATDEHQDEQDRQIALLRRSVQELAESSKNMVSAIRDLIDRIPPENLR